MIENQQVFISAVYAATSYIVRRQLWNDLSNLQQAYPAPWCFIGDFNSVLGAHEHKGRCLPLRIPCEEFRSWSDVSRLIHIDTRGSNFIWSNAELLGITLLKGLIDPYVMRIG